MFHKTAIADPENVQEKKNKTYLASVINWIQLLVLGNTRCHGGLNDGGLDRHLQCILISS